MICEFKILLNLELGCLLNLRKNILLVLPINQSNVLHGKKFSTFNAFNEFFF